MLLEGVDPPQQECLQNTCRVKLEMGWYWILSWKLDFVSEKKTLSKSKNSAIGYSPQQWNVKWSLDPKTFPGYQKRQPNSVLLNNWSRWGLAPKATEFQTDLKIFHLHPFLRLCTVAAKLKVLARIPFDEHVWAWPGAGGANNIFLNKFGIIGVR